MIAAVKEVGGDLGDGIGGTGDVQLHRVLVVQRPQEVKEGAPARVVVVHPDLLADDPLLLLDRFRGEVGLGDKIQEDFHGLPEVVGAAEKIGGAVEGGVGVGRGAGFGVFGEGVPILALKHLVLQEVGDAGGHLHKVRLLLGLEGGVDGAHLGGEHGVGGGKALHGAHEDGQAGGVLHPQQPLPQDGGGKDGLIHGRGPPSRICW